MTDGSPQRRDERPRYRQLAESLRALIETGRYMIGSLLPTENELCETYGVSRHTVRDALRLLSEAGMIQRRQGSGSLVIAAAPPSGYVHSMHSLHELFEYASDTTLQYSVIALRVPGKEFESDIGPDCSEEWLFAEGLRLAPSGREAISYSLIWINRDFAALADELPSLHGAIYARIEQQFGVEVTEVEQIIRVEQSTAGAARALGLRANSCIARVTRRYIGSAGRVLLVSVNYHPAPRFHYSMRLQREEPRGAWS